MNRSISDTDLVDVIGEHSSPKRISRRQKRGREQHDFDDEFKLFRDEMKNMIASLLSIQEKELKKISSTQLEIKETNNNIETSLNFVTQQNEELKKKIEKLEQQSTKDREYINILEDKIEDLQRAHRKTNLEIKNMPKLPNENLVNMVKELGKTIKCDVNENDIKDIYRVPSKKSDKSENTPIIVELSSKMLKTEILRMTKVFNRTYKEKLRAKHLGATKSEETAVFISEQLTAKGARLFFLARDAARTQSYKYCWTSYGRVYLRKEDNSPIIILKDESQIHNLTLMI
ncbi:unnamed protein product [Chilo suppressalis]|uniref:FP protein C-terminal domain-containing protein n=1 Tax=Chilo suppressalis TaxID=168631 RepID=A0ABN8BAG3_CHISP|nr:unnamed protein product [Chilo suppressalis]